MMETLVLCLICLLFSSSSSAARQDVYEKLWQGSQDIANDTLSLDFLQHMESGNLEAERYLNFTLQDFHYLVEVTEMLRVMNDTVTEPEDLKTFMQGRYKSYKDFAISVLSQYFLKGASEIKPTPAMRQYLDDYRAAMKKKPIYFAVALLPCSRLWVWLANSLDIQPNSAYYAFKNDNMHGHPEKHYKALLNKHLNTPKKVRRANTIFRKQMQNEHNFFASS